LGQFEKALADYAAVIELEDNVQRRLERAGLYLKQKDYDKALADYSVAVELKPPYDQARLQRAAFYRERKQYDKALADYSAAIDLERDSHHGLYWRGRTHAELGDYDKALADYTALIELEPENVHARLARAGLYRETEQHEKALADYSAAVELQPRARFTRAEFYLETKQYDEALADYSALGEHYSALVELEPDNWIAWHSRGYAHAGLGQFEKAAGDFAEAADLNPDHTYSRYAHATVRLALGDTEAYRQTCASMLESLGQTEDPETAHWVAWTCVLAPGALEDPGQAVRLAQEAVESDEESDRHLETLGAALYRAGRFEEAIQRLTELTSRRDKGKEMPTRSSPAYAWFFLAMAHHQEGHIEESRKWLSRALERAQQEITDKPLWNRRLTLEMLRREAEALLGLPEETAPGEQEVTPGEK